jgi:hypothetical protein
VEERGGKSVSIEEGENIAAGVSVVMETTSVILSVVVVVVAVVVVVVVEVMRGEVSGLSLPTLVVLGGCVSPPLMSECSVTGGGEKGRGGLHPV